MTNKITVVGLGNYGIEDLPLGIYKFLKKQTLVYTRTIDHPVIQDLTMEGINIEGFDQAYNVAFSRKNNIELNDEYGTKSKWYDLDVMADDWPKNEAKLLKDYTYWVKNSTTGSFRPDFFISSKNTLNPNSKKEDPFYEEAHKRRKATRAKIQKINDNLNKGRIGFGSPPSIFGKTVADIIKCLMKTYETHYHIL